MLLSAISKKSINRICELLLMNKNILINLSGLQIYPLTLGISLKWGHCVPGEDRASMWKNTHWFLLASPRSWLRESAYPLANSTLPCFLLNSPTLTLASHLCLPRSDGHKEPEPHLPCAQHWTSWQCILVLHAHGPHLSSPMAAMIENKPDSHVCTLQAPHWGLVWGNSPKLLC